MDVVPKIRLAALTAVLLAWPTAQPVAEPECSTAAAYRSLAKKLELSQTQLWPHDDAVLPLYRKACELGDARSCGHLGELYEIGDMNAKGWPRVRRDLPEAGRRLRQGCLGGDAPACLRLKLLTNRAAILAWNLPLFCDGHGAYHFGDLDFLDEEVQRSPWDELVAGGLVQTGNVMRFLQAVDRRLHAQRRACGRGDARACGGLGVLYAQSTFPVWEGEMHHAIRGAAEYLPLLHNGCDAGHACACYLLSKEFSRGLDIEADVGQAVDLLRKACDGGSFMACRDLGTRFDHGYDVDRDLAEAARLFRRACDGGDAHGCYFYGWDIQHGRGVERDETEAVRLFRKACDGGSGGGCGNLGRALLNGRGVEGDEAEAAHFFHQACEGRHVSSCSDLGILHLHGRGLEQNSAKAVRLLRKACDREYAYACSVLGEMLLRGDLVAHDYVEGSRLMARATGLQVRKWLRNPGSIWTDARSVANLLTRRAGRSEGTP